ncbi:MAG: FTR1 family protein [Gemmatimonadales bacterium]
MASLAAEEYRLGVRNGRVIAEPEVEEARLFLAEARRNALLLPAGYADRSVAGVDRLIAMVQRIAEPDSVARGVKDLVEGLARDLGITLDEIPAELPSLARGREVYQTNCAACHGATGRGDGPVAATLSPRPADLANPAALLASSPLDFYRRITVGVAGTAMAPYEHSLSAEDRWAVALYTSALRLPRPASVGRLPDSLRTFSTTARMTDADVLAAFGPGATMAQVAAVRILPGERAMNVAAVFAEVRRELDSAIGLARASHPEEARAMAMDAYVTFERVERDLQIKDPALTADIEAAFSSLRTRAGSGASAEQLAGIRTSLAAALERAERTIGDRPSRAGLLMQSLVILAREGLEAILIIGALMAFLVRTGNTHRRRDIHLGVGAAIVLSLITAAAIETVFALSPRHQEALEGGVMLVAAATLFYVSYWLLSKLEAAKWTRFVKSRMEHALTRGSALALASVAFLAVYREGFETVLFYQALAVSARGLAGGWLPIVAGILLASVVLAIVYLAVNRFGVRLPLRSLFGVTGTLLYAMAFIFAGKGIAELQESGAVGLTPLVGAPRIPGLGIYPTVESLAVQGALLGLALIAVAWVWGANRANRANRTNEALRANEASRAEPPSRPAFEPSSRDLLRSIERIEADLAEVRAELERMRARVRPDEPEPGRKRKPEPH